MNIAIRGIFPELYMTGGGERQIIETQAALNAIGENAFRLELSNNTRACDVLHLFHDSAAHWPIVEFCPKSLPIVVSSICPGHHRYGAYRFSWSLAEKIARVLRTRTSYGLYSDVLRRAGKIITITESHKRFYEYNYPFTKRRLEVVPNGVGDKFFLRADEQCNQRNGVVYIGSIIERKNPVLLAQALKILQIKGTFAGPIPSTETDYAARFLREIRDSGGLLSYLGPIPYSGSTHISLLRKSKVFCLPSSSEVQSLAALEAKASGCIVALGDYEYARMWPLDDSVRLKVGAVGEICDGLCRALASKPRLLEKDAFSWQAVARKVLALYKQIA